jgi:hypothetical protein
VLTTGATANQTITINASHRRQRRPNSGHKLSASWRQPNVTLTGIAIQGASSVDANTTFTYSASASYSDGSSRNVVAAWSLTSPYATIDASGVLSAQSVTGDQTVTITASYTEGEVTRTATKDVAIFDKALHPPALTGITIAGAASVNENRASTYTATASYDDGSSKLVTAVWSLTSPYATINASGVLSAQAVTGIQTVTINASYSEGADTKTATRRVTIADRTRREAVSCSRRFLPRYCRRPSQLGNSFGSGQQGGKFSSTNKANNLAVVTNVLAWIRSKGGSNPDQADQQAWGRNLMRTSFSGMWTTVYRYVRIQAHRVSIDRWVTMKESPEG